MANVTFNVIFKDGAGGVFFHGQNIPDNKFISSRMKTKSFTVDQDFGHHISTVAGSAPSGGSVIIEVKKGDTLLTKEEFKQATFGGFLVYNV
jgi:hypothetical protein